MIFSDLWWQLGKYRSGHVHDDLALFHVLPEPGLGHALEQTTHNITRATAITCNVRDTI